MLREQQPFNFYPFGVNGLPIARYNYQDAIFQEIGPDSEVFVLPQIAGG